MKIIARLRSFIFLLFGIFISFTTIQAQQSDTIQGKWYHSKAVQITAIPLGLTAIGLPTLLAERHTAISKYSIQNEFMDGPYQFQTKIDDHLRYAPAVLVYGLNLTGIKGKNSFMERSFILSKILLVQHILTTGMKRGFHLPRPSGSGHSFPSSHTAKAFATATFMHHEYKDVSLWYSAAGYSFAMVTGALRMVNNHHWLPDVLVGAGIGILSANLVYLTHQHRWTRWMNKANTKRQLVIVPTFQGSTPGVYVQLPIR